MAIESGFPPYSRPGTSQMLHIQEVYRLCASPKIQNYRFGHQVGYSFLPLVSGLLLSGPLKGSGSLGETPEIRK